MKKLHFSIFLCFLLQTVYGQYQIGVIPRVSPDKMTYQKIGFTEVEVKYGSPAIKNRPVWGELVPYDKVWRAGANSATTVEFRAPVEIAGMPLDSGRYAFFLIPKENDSWTVIFNKVARQWGAFRYNEQEDALRTAVSPRTTAYKTENLRYTISQTGFKQGSILLAWDFIEIEVPFETNYLKEFEQKINSRAAAQPEYIKWIPYLQGAEHLEEIKDRIEVAKEWINTAEEIMKATEEWNEQFYPRSYIEGHLLWIKAKILAWDKNYAAAITYVDQLKSMEETNFYDQQKDAEAIDTLAESWREKTD